MKQRDLLGALSLYFVALTVRLTPLLFSPLPYNIAGFSQVHLAEGIAASGRWSLDQDPFNAYNLKMPILPVFLATASKVLGIDPIVFVQALIALVASTAVPTTYALSRSLGASKGAGVAAGTFLALSGTFVFLTSSTIKEAFGLAFLPLFILMFQGRADPRRRVLSGLLLFLLPFLHNLTTVMALAFAGAMVVEEHTGAYLRRELRMGRALLDASFVLSLMAIPLVYYSAVRMEFFSDLLNSEDLALLLSVAFVFALLAIAISSGSPRKPLLALGARGLINGKGLVILGAGLLVVANLRRSIFPGTATTSPALLAVTLAYLPLAFFSLAGFEIARASGSRIRIAVVALIVVPLASMVFALLRGLDPISFTLLYRSFDFLDFGAAICLGMVGASSIFVSSRRRKVVGGLLLSCLFLTLPAAFLTQATFGVRNFTTPAEIASLEHFAHLPPMPEASDQRYAEILASYWSRGAEGTLPLDLEAGRTSNATYLLVAEDWTTAGAEMYPLPRVVIPGRELGSLIGAKDIIYANSQGLLILMNG